MKIKELHQANFRRFLKNAKSWRRMATVGQTGAVRGGRDGQDHCGGDNRFELRICYTRKYGIEVTGCQAKSVSGGTLVTRGSRLENRGIPRDTPAGHLLSERMVSASPRSNESFWITSQKILACSSGVGCGATRRILYSMCYLLSAEEYPRQSSMW